MAVDVLWFKKDLRVKDHQPLIEAAKSSNNLLCLFLVEPERLELDDTDHIHIEWELDNAEELAKSLTTIGGHLHIKFENAIRHYNLFTRNLKLVESFHIKRLETLGLIKEISK